MVRDHYPKLGFTAEPGGTGNGTRHVLDLASFLPMETLVEVREG
jgi:hypothetical protein